MNSNMRSSRSGERDSTRLKSRKRSATDGAPSRRKRTANGRSTKRSKSVAKPNSEMVKRTPAPAKRAMRYRMSPIEFRAIAREVLPDMRQDDIADMLMLAPRTMRRWLKGDSEIDGSSTALLRMLRAGLISRYQIKDALEQPPGLSL